LKRRVTVIILFFIALSVYGQSKQAIKDSDELDLAIREAVDYLNGRIPQGTKLAIINIKSDHIAFSEYIISELNACIVDDYFFSLVDRQQLDVIRTEQNFQLSGDVDDSSAQAIGKMLGAQAIITGSVSPLGSLWRIQIRALDVQTAQVRGQFNKNISEGETVAALTGKVITAPVKTTGQKIGTGALNILFGLGSYLEGDIAGGITLTVGYAVSAGLFVVEALALDWDSPAVGVPATIGVTVMGLTMVYGFARPFIYNHAPQVATIMDNTQPRIVLTSDTYGNRNIGFQISYNVKF
jgi:TolB-like protein